MQGCGASSDHNNQGGHGLLFLSEVPSLHHYKTMLTEHDRLASSRLNTPRAIFEDEEGADLQITIPELQSCPTPIDKYLRLRNLYKSNPKRYYELMLSKTDEVLPFIYTPTVGQACQEYHKLPLQTYGLYITLEDRGSVLEILHGVKKDIRVIVVTDGERILGLGDLGANGMGISEGKITLYTAAAGVDPSQCLPVCLDLGTNNKQLLSDPSYKGLRQNRASTQEFDSFLAEFMGAVSTRWGHVCVQFEDFGNGNAFRLLENYQENQPCFNDDIQGTASITLSAILAALRISGQELKSQTILFLGAGEAGTGIGHLIAYCLQKRYGMSRAESRSRCFFVDSKGLVCLSRKEELQEHKTPFAHDVPFCPDLKSAINQLRPTILIGVSAQPNSFDEDVVKVMSKLNRRPIIMPLSNPTSQSECTFAEAYKWSNGGVIFASGSPFDPIESMSGPGLIHPAQANNAYIFPAIGHAALLMEWGSIPQDAFLIAAETLAKMTTPSDHAQGRLFPSFSNIFEVSASVMAELCSQIPSRLASTKSLAQWRDHISAKMWKGVTSTTAQLQGAVSPQESVGGWVVETTSKL